MVMVMVMGIGTGILMQEWAAVNSPVVYESNCESCRVSGTIPLNPQEIV